MVVCTLCVPAHQRSLKCRPSLSIPTPMIVDWLPVPRPAAPVGMTEDEAFFRGLAKPAFVRNCCWCGTTKDVSVGPDPYNHDVNNDSTPVSACGKCRTERARDV